MINRVILVDLLLCIFFLGLLITYTVQVISIIKLFNFITTSKYIRGLLYIMLVVFSIFYINENFHMMVSFWGSNAVYIQIWFLEKCSIDTIFEFAQNEAAMKFFDLSLYLAFASNSVLMTSLYLLHFILSFDFRALQRGLQMRQGWKKEKSLGEGRGGVGSRASGGFVEKRRELLGLHD